MPTYCRPPKTNKKNHRFYSVQQLAIDPKSGEEGVDILAVYDAMIYGGFLQKKKPVELCPPKEG